MNKTEKNECEYIDVFFSDSDAGMFLFGSETETDRVVFNLSLSFGNINNVSDPKSRNKDYEYASFRYKEPLHSFYSGFLTEEHGFAYLKHTDKKIRMWAGKRSADQLCGLYFLVSELMDKDIYLVDIPISEKPLHIYDDTTVFLNPAPNHPNSIDDIYLLRPLGEFSFHKLSIEEKSEYSSIWNRLIEESGDIRIYIPGTGITSEKYSDFYEMLISDIGVNGEEAMRVIGRYLSAPREPQLNYSQIMAITGKMIQDGKIEVIETVKKNSSDSVSPVIRRKNLH